MKNTNTNTNMLLESKITPVKVWDNPGEQKLEILVENSGKSGIYMWKNKDSGKLYIGSAKNLKVRFTAYFNINHLTRVSNMRLNRALLKWGYSSFSLTILEYCSIESLIKREQYYIDNLEPDYNICLTAGSTLGKLHSENAKEKIRNSKKGTYEGEANSFFGETHTEESRKKMVEAKIGKTLSELVKEKISETKRGQKFTEEHKANLSTAQPNRKNVSVLDLETDIETTYVSISEAERSMGFSKGSIRATLRSKNRAPYKGRYNIKVIEE